MLGKIGQEKEKTEDEMARQYHQLNGHGFEQTPGDGEGQGNRACYSPQGHKESDTSLATEQQYVYVHMGKKKKQTQNEF